MEELPELPDPSDADPVEAVAACREALETDDVPAVDYSLHVVLAEYDRRGAQLARQAPVVEAARAAVGRYRPGCGDPTFGQSWTGAEPWICDKIAMDALVAAVRELDRPEVSG